MNNEPECHNVPDDDQRFVLVHATRYTNAAMFYPDGSLKKVNRMTLHHNEDSPQDEALGFLQLAEIVTLSGGQFRPEPIGHRFDNAVSVQKDEANPDMFHWNCGRFFMFIGEDTVIEHSRGWVPRVVADSIGLAWTDQLKEPDEAMHEVWERHLETVREPQVA